MPKLFAATVASFTDEGLLDPLRFEKNYQLYEACSALDGYVVNGTSGEAEMMDSTERRQVVRMVTDWTKRDVVSGVLGSSTLQCLKEIEQLADFDLKAVLVKTPGSYGQQLGQVEFFLRVAEESSLPILVYQIPQMTGIRLTGEQLWDLAQHPNIVGVKDSLGDLGMLAEYPWPDDFEYYLGASAVLSSGIRLGASGGILALANLVPKHCRALIDWSERPQDSERALALQRALIPLNRLIGGSRGYGVAALKAGCELRGHRCGPPRHPLKPLGEKQELELKEAMRELPSLDIFD